MRLFIPHRHRQVLFRDQNPTRLMRLNPALDLEKNRKPNNSFNFVTVTFFSFLLLFVATAQAAPYIPQSQDTVVETLPEGMPSARYASLEAIDANASANNSSVISADQVSQLLSRAYLEGDPRALGQARALLEQTEEKDSALLMLEARSLQSDHQFEAAKTVLEQILKSDPKNPDALLTLSSLLLVQGDFAKALELCTGLDQSELTIYRLACQAQVHAMTGKLKTAKQTLSELAAAAPLLDVGTARWIYLMQADAALRSADSALAQQVFSVMDTDTVPALMARADWLLKRGKYDQVIQLLKGRESQDALLIRLATAQLATCSPAAKSSLDLLAERIGVWEQRGERAHLREQTTYALLRGQNQQALELARGNWEEQRETADVLVYATAALRTASQSDLKELNQFIEETGFEYPALTQQLKTGKMTTMAGPSC